MRLVSFIAWLAVAGVIGQVNGAQPSTDQEKSQARGIRVALDVGGGKTGRFEVRGLTADQIQRIKQFAQAGAWNELFAVSVDSDKGPQPAMLGQYLVDGKLLAFEPRFALRPGMRYLAVFRPARFGEEGRDPITATFSLPAERLSDPAAVTRVYPTRSVLPENQLKFYLHFSAPMKQGDSYHYIHLLKADGTEVQLPFLELGEELWNDDGTRLTLLFDPGRIKRGLKPREEVGPSLVEGGAYTLLIDREWRGADGQPLKVAHRKSFKVGPPDERQPDPKRWVISAPIAGSREPLVVQLDESLDHALLNRVVSVRGADGQHLAGNVDIDREETRWQFRPQHPWTEGVFQLVIGTVLEDLAGNSLAKPFEVDVVRPIDRRVIEETVSIPIRVLAAK